MGKTDEEQDRIHACKELFESAVENAQILVHYAASKCKKDIDAQTLTPLIVAKQYLDRQEPLDAKLEAEFWLAYQRIWKLVSPATADTIRATKRDTARKTSSWAVIFTGLVLLVVLLLQIYWVIGNQLTGQLADLLKRETDLSGEIDANRDEYNLIEMRFKQDEWNSEVFKTNGVYTFYASPDWERDTLANLSMKAKLESDLASLKSQLERNSAVLLIWSSPWKWLIDKSMAHTNLADIDQYGSQIASLNRQITELDSQLLDDPDASKKIRETRDQIETLQKQLSDLEKSQDADSDQVLSLRSRLDNLATWVNQSGLSDQIVSQLRKDRERLKEEKLALERQQQGDLNRETSRQAQLAAQFVLGILQSYILPLLYGILGAGTFVLRSLSKEIEEETFSDQKRTQHLMRVSLGALAGILVGWFSFLIPSETTSFVGSISPLAIAFLVGYNIELFFSLMDRALFSITDRLQRPAPITDEKEKPDAPVAPPSTLTPPVNAPAQGAATD